MYWVTQKESDFNLKYADLQKAMRKNAAYDDWLCRLRPGDRVPRGKYFKGKLAVRPFRFDEFWRMRNVRL